MLPGEISLPIETPLGYHIIKLRDKRKDEVLLNHILFKIGQSDDDKQRVKNFLDSLRLQIKSLDDFKKFVDRIKHPVYTLNIGLVGKYTQYRDSYKSIIEAFIHAGSINNTRVNVQLVNSEEINSEM